ncbi:cation:proton antiporter [Motilimonas sp. KMU-193]|uniref:cation:proton antiporter domain-containing protein n=1 Tax=Motilimonas sp. KMU-193 TaxID=3388668 RepID=UPI00396AF3E5
MTATDQATPWFDKGLQVLGVLAGIFFIGRYLLPFFLGRLAHRRQMDVFGVLVFLAILSAAWAVDHVGVSMTLGSFLLGMLLSASDYRFQIESMVSPFKQTLMALFFISVGMSIDVGAIVQDWQKLLIFVPLVLLVKGLVLAGLVVLFGLRRSVAIKTGFYLSQVGEFSFVLLATATLAGLLTDTGHSLAMLVVATSMILTPLMVKLGNRLADKFSTAPSFQNTVSQPLEKHVVIVGYDEVGQLIDLMLDKAGIPHIAFERDIDVVIKGKKIGRNVHYGDMYSSITQDAAGLNKASAIYISVRDIERAKALAVTLHSFYPSLDIFVRVGTLKEQSDLVAKGIKNAGTGYIESTLIRGSVLLKQLGITESEVIQLVSSLQTDNYDLIRTEYAKFDG